MFGSPHAGTIPPAPPYTLPAISRRSQLHSSLRRLAVPGHGPRRRLAAAVILGLFAGLYLLGDADPGTFEATLLFVVPIVLAAIEFGVLGGLAAGLVALALVRVWDLSETQTALEATDYVSRAIAYLLLGGLVGRFVTVRRALEEKIARSEELSLDLMATLGADGYFKRLNRSWERLLDWSLEELYARPLVDFVHPDDRRRTLHAFTNVSAGRDAIGFRNRFLARDGSYRWLEWNARADTGEPGINHANARDITVLQHAEETIRCHGEQLARTVAERTAELEHARRETLRRLALAAEYRDDDTHQHTERVGHTSMLIARALGLPEETVRTIRDAAPLHDIGKLGISDTILLKPGPLTDDERDTMQRHSRIGAAILAHGSSSVLRMAEEIALRHHERWDGTGYPCGLACLDIPLTARITAVADTFDAITHRRPYVVARTVEDALAEIRRVSGTHIDPDVVDAFLTLDHAALLRAEHDLLERAVIDAAAHDELSASFGQPPPGVTR